MANMKKGSKYCRHRSSYAWGTKSELGFLRDLGTWSGSRHTRLYLLRKYLRAMQARNRWDKIDANEVRQYVKEEIEREEMNHAMARGVLPNMRQGGVRNQQDS